MEWIIAVCSAGLNLAAVWLVQKKTGLYACLQILLI